MQDLSTKPELVSYLGGVKIMLKEMRQRKSKQVVATSEDLRENSNKQKLNIFDTQDSNVLKHETIARLGYDEKALVPVDHQSDTSSVKSQNNVSVMQRPKAIEYLKKGKQ